MEHVEKRPIINKIFSDVFYKREIMITAVTVMTMTSKNRSCVSMTSRDKHCMVKKATGCLKKKCEMF